MSITNRYYRITVFVAMAVKFFLQIWFFRRRYSSGALHGESWERLLQKQAAEYKRKALKLKGLTIKVGQFLSTRADLMPDAFTHELKDLIDRVPPVSWNEAKTVMEREWNVPYDSVLAEISEAPVASASIADVYRARLASGEEVAVKIQRPEMERIIQADFRAIRAVFSLAKRFTKWGKALDLNRLYKELVETISKELDFRKEREHAARFAGIFKGKEFQLYVPRYYNEWVTARVLVMEWIDGVPVTDVGFMARHGIPRDDVVRRIVGCSLHQILHAGFFHADPHPGNILLKPDGTLVFLDFGMMGSITPQAKQSIRLLVRAVVEQNYERMVEALDQLRFIRKGVDRHRLAGALQMGLEFYLHRSYQQLDDELLEQMMTEIRDFVQTQPIQMPAQYAFLGRAFSTLTGVVTSIQPDVDYLEAGRPFVQGFLQEGGEDGGDTALSYIKETAKDLLLEIIRLPHQLNSWFDLEKKKLYFERKRHQTERLQQYYEERKRMLIVLVVLTAAGGTTLYILSSRWMGISAYVLSLMFLVFYKVLDRRLFRMIQSNITQQEGDPHE